MLVSSAIVFLFPHFFVSIFEEPKTRLTATRLCAGNRIYLHPEPYYNVLMLLFTESAAALTDFN